MADVPPPPEGIEGFDAPPPPDGVQGFDAPSPPDGVQGFDAPPPPDGVEGFDAPPSTDGGVGSDVSPPPDGIEGFDAPLSTEGVVGSDALLSTPDEQGPDLPTQASPPDSDISSLPEENAEFDSGLDLDPTDELDVPAVAEGAGAAELVDEETPDLQDSPSADVKSKDEFTPQDGIPTEEPSSDSQSEPAHANAPRRNRKPALLALALAVGGAAWAITQTGSDGDTGAGNSEVANFADEEEPTTSTSELAEEAPSTTIAGPNEEATTTSVSESDEEVPTTTIDEADSSSPTTTSGVPETSAPTVTSDGAGTGPAKSIAWSSADLPTRVVVGQQFPWSFSIVSVGGPIGGWQIPYFLTCDPYPGTTPGNGTTFEFSWSGTCVANSPVNDSYYFETSQYGNCEVCPADGPYPGTFEAVVPMLTAGHSAFVECDYVRVEYQIDAPTYDGLIEWTGSIEWMGQEYPIPATSGSIRVPIGSGTGSQFATMRLGNDFSGTDIFSTSVFISDDPVENGCEPAPTTTTTEPAPTTTTTLPSELVGPTFEWINDTVVYNSTTEGYLYVEVTASDPEGIERIGVPCCTHTASGVFFPCSPEPTNVYSPPFATSEFAELRCPFSETWPDGSYRYYVDAWDGSGRGSDSEYRYFELNRLS